MAKRVLSTVALWIGIGLALGYGRTDGLVALAVLASVLTLREFYRLQAAAGFFPFAKLGLFFGGLITLAPWAQARFGWPGQHLLPLATVVFCLRSLGERPAERRVSALASTLFGLVYVALLFQYLVRIAVPSPAGGPPAGERLLLCLWVVVVAKFCDTGALLVGQALGRHPFAQAISPKKTWEGAVGGVLVAVLVGSAGAWIARFWQPAFPTPLRAAATAAPIAAFAIASDLVESALKRQAGHKDSGRLLPGIGGVFDATDSVLLAAPVAYFLLGFH